MFPLHEECTPQFNRTGHYRPTTTRVCSVSAASTYRLPDSKIMSAKCHFSEHCWNISQRPNGAVAYCSCTTMHYKLTALRSQFAMSMDEMVVIWIGTILVFQLNVISLLCCWVASVNYLTRKVIKLKVCYDLNGRVKNIRYHSRFCLHVRFKTYNIY